MAVLSPDKVLTVTINGETLKINQKIIPDSLVASKTVCSWIAKGQKMKPCAKLNGGTGKPRGITVHNTESIKVASNTTEAEQYVRATYGENMGGVVVHYYVCGNAIWQMLSNEERGWHSTDGQKRINGHSGATYSTICGNTDTISIECIGSSPDAELMTAKLVAYLCKTYSLNPEKDVYSHNYFYSKKYCPTYILPHWDNFISNVVKYYKDVSNKTTKDKVVEKANEKTDTIVKTTTSTNVSGAFKVKVIYKDGVNVRKSANSLSKKVGLAKFGDVLTIVKTNNGNTWGYLKSGLGWICIKSKYVRKV